MNPRRRIFITLALISIWAGSGYVLEMLADAGDPEPSQGWTLTTWNDLGMHCMDEDFSIFAILPPFNTLNAELIDKNGDRVSGGGGIAVFYQDGADPDGRPALERRAGLGERRLRLNV